MWTVEFSDDAVSDLKQIDAEIRKRILNKIRYFASLDDPRSVAVAMINYRLGQWRRRIGDRRVIFDIDAVGKIIIVLIVEHRSTIYQ